MERIFCNGKKKFCDDVTKCGKCEFKDGTGVVGEKSVKNFLSVLFGDDYDLDRLRELAEADRDGRCVVLPAGIGDTIYHITKCKGFPQVLDGTMYSDDGSPGTATGVYCPCELAENCPFPCDDDGCFDCDKHKNTLAIFEDIVDSIHIEDMDDYIIFNYSGGADFENFGKTVFLTREAAEEALKEREKENV